VPDKEKNDKNRDAEKRSIRANEEVVWQNGSENRHLLIDLLSFMVIADIRRVPSL
jgi:hypothetical protein